MTFLASLTRRQRLVLLTLLVLNVLCIYGVVIPIVVNLMMLAPTPIAEEPTEPPELAFEFAPEPPTPAPARTPTRTPTPTRTATPTPTILPTPTSTAIPVATPIPAPVDIAGRNLAELELNPRVVLNSRTTFFTSACFGDGANPLQDRDFMAPADWSSSPDRKCIFGFRVNSLENMPSGRYSVFGGPDGQPRFYVSPPDAFAPDRRSIKQLSQIQLIVDPDHGCESLGSIGVTADGLTYQCPACDFLKAGGMCSTANGAKRLVMPSNKHNLLDPGTTGGAYGVVNFPLVVFRDGFSLYFTGTAGYAPPRIWFDNVVDTLAPSIDLKTTAEMSDREIRDVAAQFDNHLTSDPLRQVIPLEHEAQPVMPTQVRIKSREKATFEFVTAPGAVLSSIVWKIRPMNNVDKREFLETNFCLGLNGEENCFTGVEDFAHCAFFTPCRTGYSSLIQTDDGGYLATRYFSAGAAPVIQDGHITAKFQAPDIGTVLEIQVHVRVRNAR